MIFEILSLVLKLCVAVSTIGSFGAALYMYSYYSKKQTTGNIHLISFTSHDDSNDSAIYTIKLHNQYSKHIFYINDMSITLKNGTRFDFKHEWKIDELSIKIISNWPVVVFALCDYYSSLLESIKKTKFSDISISKLEFSGEWADKHATKGIIYQNVALSRKNKIELKKYLHKFKKIVESGIIEKLKEALELNDYSKIQEIMGISEAEVKLWLSEIEENKTIEKNI